MGEGLSRGSFIFFSMGALIFFLPTILLGSDRDSFLWQFSIMAFMANIAVIVLTTLLLVLKKASTFFPSTTMLTFAALATGIGLGLFIGESLAEFWYLVAAPSLALLVSAIMAGGNKQAEVH